MGRDIELHAELKLDGKWHHCQNIPVLRNSMLFAKLSGDCNFYEAADGIASICKSRGLPEDCAELTQAFHDNQWTEAFHQSWVDAGEIVAICQWGRDIFGNQNWEEETFGSLRHRSWSEYASDMLLKNRHDDTGKHDENVGDDIRWVFWFSQ